METVTFHRMPGPDGWRQTIRLFRFLNHHRHAAWSLVALALIS
jgi:hypothetical protein